MSSTDFTNRLLVVGDIHGCADEVDVILNHVAPSAGDTIVFVGDYIDRGPSPRDVIDRMIELRDRSGARCVFLKGNHEDMFLSWLGDAGRYGECFLQNGGSATIRSYGITSERGGEHARNALPPQHLDFFRSLSLWEQQPPYLFVHAGIAPLQTLEEQDEEQLLWIREEFVRNRHLLGATVIFGHTPQREVLWHLPWKIGIDTGCVYGNKLSCLDLTSREMLQTRRGSGAVTRRSIRAELARREAEIAETGARGGGRPPSEALAASRPIRRVR